MPISNKGFTRTSFALLLVGLAALVAIVATTIWLVERNQAYFDEVTEARLARREVVTLRQLIQQAETGQRGYLLTLDAAYLEPYDAAVGQISESFAQLETLLEPYPQAVEPMAQLRADLDTKLAEMDQTIEFAQQGDIGEAVSIVRTDAGERAMGRIRTFFDALIEAADARILSGVIGQRDAAAWLRWVAMAGAVVIIGVMVGAVWLVRRYMRDLDQARLEMETLNSDLEERVTERTEELMRANEEVQRFAYIVTHDLRAPLVNIMGFTSELEASLPPIKAVVERHKDEQDDPEIVEARQVALEDLPEALEFIRSSTKKMDGLINAILKISREGRRELRAERIEVEEVIQTAANAVQHQVSESEGEITVTAKTPPIFTDRLSLDQILGNILDNAVKYRAPDRPLHIAIQAWQERSGRVVIEIADNGRGIAPEDHERVFELFRRSGTQDQKGEGIGLAHVRILARNLGGDITLKSEFGKGTTFTIIVAPDLRAIRRQAP